MSYQSVTLPVLGLSLSILFAGCASAPPVRAPSQEFSAGFDSSSERMLAFLHSQGRDVLAAAIDDVYVTPMGYGIYADKIVRLGREYAIASDPAFCAGTKKEALTKLGAARDEASANAYSYGGAERIAGDYEEARQILDGLCSSPAATLP